MTATEYQSYGYINTVVSEIYKDIPTEHPFPAAHLPDLYKYITNEYLLNSSQECVYTYFSVAKGSEPPIGIFSKCAKKKNANSVCRYTQAVGWAWSEGELYRDAFDSILKFGFYSENEVDRAAQGKVLPFGHGSDAGKIDLNLQIHPSALRVLLCAAFLRWMRSDPLVRIAVPAKYTGELYNTYVLSAVNQLYSYLPVGLRLKAGFSSYLPTGGEKGLPNLYFGFIPESEADKTAVFLDGSSLAVYQNMPKSVGRGPLDYLINALLERTESHQRQLLINTLFADADGRQKIATLTPSKYYYIADTLRLMTHTKSTLEMMPAWFSFCSAPEKYPLSLIPELWDMIRKELTEPVFSDYLEEKYPDAMPLEDYAGSLDKIAVFLEVGPVVNQCFWARTTQILSKSQNLDAVAFFLKNEKELKKFGKQTYDQHLVDWKKRLIKEAISASLDVLEKLDSNATDCQQIQSNSAEIQQKYKQFLASYLQEAESGQVLNAVQLRASDHIAALVHKKFQEVQKMPVDKMEQIQAAIAGTQTLLTQLKGTIGDKAGEARKTLQAFKGDLEAKLNANSTIKKKINSELQTYSDYFKAIAHIFKAMRENRCLEPHDQEVFMKKAREKKPKTENSYFEAYAKSIGQPLTMESLHKQNLLVIRCVLQDLQEFFAQPYSLDSRSSVQAMYDSIVKRQALIGHFLGVDSITLKLNDAEVGTEKLKSSLILDNVQLTDKEQRGTIETLMKAGAYGGADLPKLGALYVEQNQAIKPLLDAISLGCFKNATELEYRLGLEPVCSAAVSNGVSWEDLESSLGIQKLSNSAVKKAFDKLRNDAREVENLENKVKTIQQAAYHEKSLKEEAQKEIDRIHQDAVKQEKTLRAEADRIQQIADQERDLKEKAQKEIDKIKKNTGYRSRYPLIITAAVLGVLTVGLITTSGLLYLKNKEQAKAIQARDIKLEDMNAVIKSNFDLETNVELKDLEIQGLLAEQQKTAGLSFVLNNLESYAKVVRNMIDSKDTAGSQYAVFNRRYCSRNKDYYVTLANGELVTWGEYCFWECYFVLRDYETASPEIFDQKDIQVQVKAALLLYHGVLETAPVEKKYQKTTEKVTLPDKYAPIEQSLENDFEKIIETIRKGPELTFQIVDPPADLHVNRYLQRYAQSSKD